MGEPGEHISYTHTYTHTHTQVNLEGIWACILHTRTGEPGKHISYTYTHTGEGGGHISYTHTQGWPWRAYGHISYTHTRVNLEGIYLIHAHRIHFGLKNRNPASGTTMGEPRSHCPK